MKALIEGWKAGVEPKLGALPVERAPIAIEARKGFAAPPPVIWGLSPTPNVDPTFEEPPKPPIAPVGWLLKKLKLLGVAPLVPFAGEEVVLNRPVPAGLGVLEGRPVIAGVVGWDPGTGGRDSSREAPNDEDGLNGFKPVNPVTCDFTGVSVVEKEVLVVPVAWLERVDENNELEKVDPEADVVLVVEVSCGDRGPLAPVGLEKPGLFLFQANDDATLDMSVAPGFSVLLLNEKLVNPVACGLTCWGC